MQNPSSSSRRAALDPQTDLFRDRIECSERMPEQRPWKTVGRAMMVIAGTMVATMAACFGQIHR